MTDRSSILGVILAGGLSRRMGGPEKSLMELAGRPLITHVRDRLAPQVDTIIVNANGDAARFGFLKLPVQADTIEGHAGPLAGILAGMRWAQTNTPSLRAIATVPTDTPLFPHDLVSRLSLAAEGRDDTIALARSDGHRHPVVGLWPVALDNDLETFLRSGEGGKVMRFAQRHRLVDVDFEPREVDGMTLDPFFNANTPDDLKEAGRFLSGARIS